MKTQQPRSLYSGDVVRRSWNLVTVWLISCWLLPAAVVALNNGEAATPLMGHIWESCTSEQLQDRAILMQLDLKNNYPILHVGHKCFPNQKQGSQKLGVNLGLKLGSDCSSVSFLSSGLVKSWNISLVELSTSCMQPGKGGHGYVLDKTQHAKLKRVALSVCSPVQSELPWLWAPRVANQWCLPVGEQASKPGTWERVLNSLDNTAVMGQFAGPGAWNDLGPLQVGAWSGKAGPALQQAMDRSQFALWAVLKSPLMVAGELNNMAASSLKVLNNEAIIAVNQDPLGVPGALLWKLGSLELYAGPLQGGQRVVLCFNRGDDAAPGCTVRWAQLGLPASLRATVEDLYQGNSSVASGEFSTARVAARDVVVLRISPAKKLPETSTLQWDMWRPWQHNMQLFSSRCHHPAAVTGGIVLMTLAVCGIALSGLTYYWVWATPQRKGFQPVNRSTKMEEDA